MTLDRRTFNRYVAGGLLGGAGATILAVNYSTDKVCNDATVHIRNALQEAATAAAGVHQIGLNAEKLDSISAADAQCALLDRLAPKLGDEGQSHDVFAALDLLIREDYANHETLVINGYALSKSEVLFITYAIKQQGLNKIAYVAPRNELSDGIIAAKIKFGPMSTVVGQVFNEQLDGHGGLWVLANNVPVGTVIAINGTPIKTSWGPKSISGAVYNDELKELIATPASHEISLQVPARGLRQIIGELIVKPRPPAAILEDGTSSKVFCEIEKWSTWSSGSEEKLRIETLCGPRSAAVYIGNIVLSTRVLPGRIEAVLDRSVLPKGAHPIRLIDTLSGEAVALGNFKVN
jgi:hypothetical protein